MDTTQQRAILDAVAAAALEEGCFVAPVGSVYFLLSGSPRMTTKDVDIVVHDKDLQPPDVDVLQRIAARLASFGDARTTTDRAVVQIHATEDAPAEIELIRGRSDAKRGFFPRALLVEAAKGAARNGNVLVYPIEYILVLKADAAIDREDRATRDVSRAAEHIRRANAFRADVMGAANAALIDGTVRAKVVEKAISYLKKARQVRVRQLLAAAGVAFNRP